MNKGELIDAVASSAGLSRADATKAVDSVLESITNTLKAGSSVFPLQALKMAGVDMTSPEPVETTFAVLAGYVDKLEKLIEQREKGKFTHPGAGLPI